jgi:hypothetical protein
MASGRIVYGLEATDGTDVCALAGEIAWAIVDKSGSFTGMTTTPIGSIKAQSGTNCGTFTVATAFSSNAFQMTPTLSTMSPTTFRITYTIQNYGQSTITLN